VAGQEKTKFRGRDRVGWSFANTARERLTLIQLFEELRALGYEGGYDAVRRYAKSSVREHPSQTADAYVPLTFAPGEAYATPTICGRPLGKLFFGDASLAIAVICPAC
jgi:hypothetical protein